MLPDVFSKIADVLEEHAGEIKAHDESYRKHKIDAISEKKIVETPLDNLFSEDSNSNKKLPHSKKVEKLKEIKKTSFSILQKDSEKKCKLKEKELLRLQSNSGDFNKLVDIFELMYLSMSELERTELESSIVALIRDTNTLTIGDIQNMDGNFLSQVSISEIEKIEEDFNEESSFTQNNTPGLSPIYTTKNKHLKK